MDGRPNSEPDEILSTDLTRPLRVVDIFVNSYTDSSGIPLASDRDDPRLIQGIDFQKQPNPFRTSPSRYPNGKPHEVPVSELERERLRQFYPEMLSLLGRVRSTYITETRKKTGRNLDASLTLSESLSILSGLSYLPHYLAHRSTRPFALQGELPPQVIVLSNAASGSRGAMYAFADLHIDDPDAKELVPDKTEAIAAIERMGSLISEGKTSVCAASPKQIDHFLGAVIDGPPENTKGMDFLKERLPDTELMSVINFGISFDQAEMLTSDIKKIDYPLAQAIVNYLNQGVNPQAVLLRFMGHIDSLEQKLRELTQRQRDMNKALGRNTEAKPLSLLSLKHELHLVLPDVLLKLSSLQ